MSKKKCNVNLITLGDTTVGKSSLIYRYIDDIFNENLLPTIGIDFKTINIKISEDEEIGVRIFDTAGQERYKTISNNYIKNADGILFIYDITRLETFERVKVWVSDIEDKEKNLPSLLIGNKSDLEKKRQVPKEKGEELAKNLNFVNYFETSCQNGNNVKESINTLAEYIYRLKSKNEEPKDIKKFVIDKYGNVKEKKVLKNKCCK